jgi:hypothetical protein
VIVETLGFTGCDSPLLSTQPKEVRVGYLALETQGVRTDDLLDIAVAPGAFVEAVAGVAAPLDEPPTLLSAVAARPHGTPVYPYGATG